MLALGPRLCRLGESVRDMILDSSEAWHNVLRENARLLREREQNRKRAAIWCAWLAARYRCAPVCTWITLAEVWPETMRDVGLEIDRALVQLVGLVLACGARWSPGMRAEAAWAEQVVDMTRCEMPSSLTDTEVEWLDSEMARLGIARRDG